MPKASVDRKSWSIGPKTHWHETQVIVYVRLPAKIEDAADALQDALDATGIDCYVSPESAEHSGSGTGDERNEEDGGVDCSTCLRKERRAERARQRIRVRETVTP